MQLRRSFEVAQTPEAVTDRLCCDETLLALLPGNTELVASEGDRRTTRTRYRRLGQEGLATFHFVFRMDGSIAFEKVCDGKVWRELSGLVTVEGGAGSGSRVVIEMSGRTKGLVPEFTIKGAMEEQIGEMSRALRARLEEA